MVPLHMSLGNFVLVALLTAAPLTLLVYQKLGDEFFQM